MSPLAINDVDIAKEKIDRYKKLTQKHAHNPEKLAQKLKEASYPHFPQHYFIETVEKGCYELVEYMINSGIVDPGCTIEYGYDGVQAATFKEIDPKILELILENGGDANSEGYYGNSPLMDAASNDDIEKVKILLRYGADPTYANCCAKNRGEIIRAVDCCKDPNVRDMLTKAMNSKDN